MKIIYLLGGLVCILFLEIFYLSNKYSLTKQNLKEKNSFISFTGLPDLSISNEAFYIRHRSLNSVFLIYKEDPTLREFAPSSFAINYGKIK